MSIWVKRILWMLIAVVIHYGLSLFFIPFFYSNTPLWVEVTFGLLNPSAWFGGYTQYTIIDFLINGLTWGVVTLTGFEWLYRRQIKKHKIQ